MKEIADKPTIEELDYFKMYLTEYLDKNNFVLGDEDYKAADSLAESAAEIFEDSAANGETIVSAIDIAINSMFTQVGSSGRQLVMDVIAEEFPDLISFDTDLELGEAADFFIENIPDLFENIEECEFGYSNEDIDLTKTILAGRLQIYLESHGIQ